MEVSGLHHGSEAEECGWWLDVMCDDDDVVDVGGGWGREARSKSVRKCETR